MMNRDCFKKSSKFSGVELQIFLVISYKLHLKIHILISLSDSENQINLPCIWTRNSVFIRLAASLSFSLLDPQRESISSMKMIEGLFSLASWNKFFTNLKEGNSFSYINNYNSRNT